MKLVVEDCTPYKPYTMGEILKHEDGENKMVRFPKEESDTVSQMLKDAKTFLDFHYTWPEGFLGISVTEHNTDSNIHIKELFVKNIDKLRLCAVPERGLMDHSSNLETTCDQT